MSNDLAGFVKELVGHGVSKAGNVAPEEGLMMTAMSGLVAVFVRAMRRGDRESILNFARASDPACSMMTPESLAIFTELQDPDVAFAISDAEDPLLAVVERILEHPSMQHLRNLFRVKPREAAVLGSATGVLVGLMICHGMPDLAALIRNSAPDREEGGLAAAKPKKRRPAGKRGAKSQQAREAHNAALLVEQAALKAQRCVDPGTSLLRQPLVLEESIESPWRQLALLRWGYFNPFGPTACALNLTGCERTRTYLIVLESLHPFSPAYVVYAMLRDALLPSIQSVLGSLFAKNGSKEAPLMGGLPSHIYVPQGSPLVLDFVRGLFKSILTRLDRPDPARVAAAMRKYWCKPWDRAGEEVDLGVKAVVGRAKGSGSTPPAVTAKAFDDWFSLATHVDHVTAELLELPAAWAGAIDFLQENTGT